MPHLSRLISRARRLSRGTADPERRERLRVFADIHARNAWADAESASGPGSGVRRAAMFREDLEALLRELQVGSILDAPCGDFNWLPTFALDGIDIVGVDIVPELIAANRAGRCAPGSGSRSPTWRATGCRERT